MIECYTNMIYYHLGWYLLQNDEELFWQVESLCHSWWNYLEDVIHQQLMERAAA